MAKSLYQQKIVSGIWRKDTCLTRLTRALEKAAKEGNIAAAKRAQRSMSEAINSLRREVANSVESWPFEEEEEQQYLSGDYGQELRSVAAEKGLDIYERDGRIIPTHLLSESCLRPVRSK